MKTYKDVTWDPEDLMSSAQAVRCLVVDGISEEEILSLDFGNLDIAVAIEEA